MAFDFEAAAYALAAVASWLRCGKCHHAEERDLSLSTATAAEDGAHSETSGAREGSRAGEANVVQPDAIAGGHKLPSPG